MTSFFDADQYQQELDQKGPVVHLYGSDWECPADIPADVEWRRSKALASAAKLMRQGKLDGLDDLGPDDEIPPELAEQIESLSDLDAEELYEAYIGKDNLAAWREYGIGKRVLGEILRRLIAHHEGREPEGNRAARRAKTTQAG